MKKTVLILAGLIIFSAMCACGKQETADSYADKLASGEIEPGDVKVDYSKTTEQPSDAPAAATEQPAAAATETAGTDTVADTTANIGEVNLSISEEDMGKMIDNAQDEYKSFEIQPLESADFFIGKKLRIAATISEHQLQNIYANDIEADFSDGKMKMKYPTTDGTTEQEFYIYTVADAPLTSPEGRQYSYIAYGSNEITPGTTDGTIALVTLIKLKSDIDMGDAAADTYVMLQETSNSDSLNILKVEE